MVWSTFVLSLACIILVNGDIVVKSQSLSDIQKVMSMNAIPDTEYEQVVAKRYLFAPFANESTAWPVLTNIQNIWQVVSLPYYYSQAHDEFWLLTQGTDSSAVKLHMSRMSLSTNNISVVLPEIDMNSFLVISHNKTTSMTYTGALISLNRIQLFLCNEKDASSCKITKTISFPSQLRDVSTIADGLFVGDLGAAGWLFIATNTGLHGLDLSTYVIHPYINEINVSVSSLAWSAKYHTYFIGTEAKLWFYSYGINSEGWRMEHVIGLIDAPITSLVYNDEQDKLWIGQETGITLLRPTVMSTGRVHWIFSRLAGQISNPGSYDGHLPFANITSLSVSHSVSADSRVWLGSVYGVMRFDPNDTEINAWRVYNSARYMPNRDALVNVTSLAVLSHASTVSSSLGSTAVAVTNKGLAVLQFEMWTLAQKAKHFQDFFNQPSRHDKYGFVSCCKMSSWGDARTCVKESDDNDGLWTSMYLGSQIFRYVVTKDPTVKASAWLHFEALETLNRVTGNPGYPARSFANRTEPPLDPDWYLSPVYPNLQFKGDTSSDEIVGHEFIYPLVHDLLASTEDERLSAYALVFNITNHIYTHDWYLVGELHNHTTWGVWNPKEINNDINFLEDRGLNSLEILTYLLQIYAYNGNERYLDGAQLLVKNYQYDVNLINQKMIAACDSDYSDDELLYLSCFSFIHAINSITSSTILSVAQKLRAQIIIDNLLEYMMIGLNEAHKYKQMEKSPFFNFIYCYIIGQVNQTKYQFNRDHVSSPEFDCNTLSKDAIWYMQRWPLEMVNYPQFNKNRLDVQLNVEAECGGSPSSLQMLPPDERTIGIWNSNVYSLDDGYGYKEEDPSAFLISYWGMRFSNLLGE